MYKIVLVFCLALTVAQAVPQAVAHDGPHTDPHADNERNDDYINLNRYQNQKILDNYDAQLAFFEEHYNGRVEAADVQRELITAALVHNEKRFTPFTMLGNYFKNCVRKYNSVVPSIVAARKAITDCEYVAKYQLTALLSAPRNTRKVLEKYLYETYEEYLTGCAQEHGFYSTNYTVCVTSVTALANVFTIGNQKQFSHQLEAAICTAKAHIKALLDCTFTEHSRVVGIISEVKALIQNCFHGKDECKPCEKYTCSESYDVDVNNGSLTIKNPFFGSDSHRECLMLNAHVTVDTLH